MTNPMEQNLKKFKFRSNMLKETLMDSYNLTPRWLSLNRRLTANKKVPVSVENQNLILALTRKRTMVTYGYFHYCHCH